jgi:hypothetical protein
MRRMREHRLVVARTADVLAHFEQRIRLREVPASNDADPEAIALARVAARRVSRAGHPRAGRNHGFAALASRQRLLRTIGSHSCQR